MKRTPKQYKNVGAMAMVTSDAQLTYALNSDWIDMIIPFHSSSLDKKVWYDLRAWFDYTSKQGERFYNSKEMELALVQKKLDEAGIEYSSEDMKRTLIEAAKEKGAGLDSNASTRIISKEVTRLNKLARSNGISLVTDTARIRAIRDAMTVEPGQKKPSEATIKTREIRRAYLEEFNIKVLVGTKGNIVKPHFLPGETIDDGATVPGHNNDIERYKQLCREYGVHPRFDGVAVEDANGNLINAIDHPNYLKLIKETARTDTKQETIQFNFDQYDEYLGKTPFEFAMDLLKQQASISGYDNLKTESTYHNAGIVDRFIDEYVGKDRPIGYLPRKAKQYRDHMIQKQNEINNPKGLPLYKESSRVTQSETSEDTSLKNDREDSQYLYSNLIKKPDMLVTHVDFSKTYDRSTTVEKAKENAKAIGRIDNNGAIRVRVDDIGKEVIISSNGLKHGLKRKLEQISPITVNIGSILKHSIKINELIPRNDIVNKTYVLIGAATDNNEISVVRSIVNSYTNELEDIDVLYAIASKKEVATTLTSPGITSVNLLPVTTSYLKISELLKYVNDLYPDILPKDV